MTKTTHTKNSTPADHKHHLHSSHHYKQWLLIHFYPPPLQSTIPFKGNVLMCPEDAQMLPKHKWSIEGAVECISPDQNYLVCPRVWIHSFVAIQIWPGDWLPTMHIPFWFSFEDCEPFLLIAVLVGNHVHECWSWKELNHLSWEEPKFFSTQPNNSNKKILRRMFQSSKLNFICRRYKIKNHLRALTQKALSRWLIHLTKNGQVSFCKRECKFLQPVLLLWEDENTGIRTSL